MCILIHKKVKVNRHFRTDRTLLDFIRKAIKRLLKKHLRSEDLLVEIENYSIVADPNKYQLGVFSASGSIYSREGNVLGDFYSEWVFDERGFVFEGEVKIWLGR